MELAQIFESHGRMTSTVLKSSFSLINSPWVMIDYVIHMYNIINQEYYTETRNRGNRWSPITIRIGRLAINFEN